MIASVFGLIYFYIMLFFQSKKINLHENIKI